MSFKIKHEYLQHEIKKLIKENDMKPNDKLPSELEFQEMFDVSRHTVRTALSKLEYQGVIYKEQGLGSFVSGSINRSSNREIGVITTYISDYIFPTIIRGIEQELTKASYSMILTSTNNNVESEKKAIEMLMKREVDGLIIEPTKSAYYNSNIGSYLQLKEIGIPIMMLNARYDEITSPMVTLNDYQAGYDVTELLINNGHTKLGGLFKIDDKQGKERLRGFIQACYDYGIEYNSDVVVVYETETLNKLLETQVKDIIKNREITGFVSYNDKVSIEVLNIIWRYGLSVPEDISLVSHDDSSLSTMTKVNLTGVNHPKSELGKEAAIRLINYLEGKTDKMESKEFEGELIIRDSVRDLNS